MFVRWRAYGRDNRLFVGARCARTWNSIAAGDSLARSLACYSCVISCARVLKRPSYYRFVRGGSVTIEQLGLLHRALLVLYVSLVYESYSFFKRDSKRSEHHYNNNKIPIQKIRKASLNKDIDLHSACRFNAKYDIEFYVANVRMTCNVGRHRVIIALNSWK